MMVLGLARADESNEPGTRGQPHQWSRKREPVLSPVVADLAPYFSNDNITLRLLDDRSVDQGLVSGKFPFVIPACL